MHEPSVVLLVETSLLGHCSDCEVSTFSSVSNFCFFLFFMTQKAAEIFLSSLSLVFLFCCQNHIENIVYNWCLIAAVATVLFKPTRSVTKACGEHAHAKRKEKT